MDEYVLEVSLAQPQSHNFDPPTLPLASLLCLTIFCIHFSSARPSTKHGRDKNIQEKMLNKGRELNSLNRCLSKLGTYYGLLKLPFVQNICTQVTDLTLNVH